MPERILQNRRWTDRVVNIKNTILAVIALASALSGGAYFAWDILARPDIRKEIKCVSDPMADALEFQTYLMMENLSDEQVARAQNRYLTAKRSKSGQ